MHVCVSLFILIIVCVCVCVCVHKCTYLCVYLYMCVCVCVCVCVWHTMYAKQNAKSDQQILLESYLEPGELDPWWLIPILVPHPLPPIPIFTSALFLQIKKCSVTKISNSDLARK